MCVCVCVCVHFTLFVYMYTATIFIWQHIIRKNIGDVSGTREAIPIITTLVNSESCLGTGTETCLRSCQEMAKSEKVTA